MQSANTDRIIGQVVLVTNFILKGSLFSWLSSCHHNRQLGIGSGLIMYWPYMLNSWPLLMECCPAPYCLNCIVPLNCAPPSMFRFSRQLHNAFLMSLEIYPSIESLVNLIPLISLVFLSICIGILSDI